MPRQKKVMTGEGWGAVEGYNPDGSKMSKEQQDKYRNRFRLVPSMVGEGLPANVLKEFIDMSYLGNTSVAPAGYSIDAPLSDSRVKVYTKNGSNDKNVIVTHRGSVGLDDWWDNAKYMTMGKVKGTKTYELHRARHKAAIDKYGAKNIIAIGHSRAGLYLQELQKEFPIKENITYNKATGFSDIGRQNTTNQTDVRVGNDVVSLLSGTQKNPNKVIGLTNTKNPFDFNKAHQTGELEKLGTQFVGLADDEATGSGILPKIADINVLTKMLKLEQTRLVKIENGYVYKSKTMTKEKITEKIKRIKQRISNLKKGDVSSFIPTGEKWLKMNLYSTLTSKPRTNKQIIAMIEALLKKVSKAQTLSPEEKSEVVKQLKSEKSHYESMKKNIDSKVQQFEMPAPSRLPQPLTLKSDFAKQKQINKLERSYKSTSDEGVRENILGQIKTINKTLPPLQRINNSGWVEEAKTGPITARKQTPRPSTSADAVRDNFETAVVMAAMPRSIPVSARLALPEAIPEELTEKRRKPLVLLTKPSGSKPNKLPPPVNHGSNAPSLIEPRVFKTSQEYRDKQNARRRANAAEYAEQRKTWDSKRYQTISGIKALGLDPREIGDKYNRDRKRLGVLEVALEKVKDPKKRSDYLEEMSAIRRRRPQYEAELKPIYQKYLGEIVNSGNTLQNETIEASEPRPAVFLQPVDQTGQIAAEVEMSDKRKGKMRAVSPVVEETFDDSDYEVLQDFDIEYEDRPDLFE